jgi:hypothetical protein
VASTSPAGLPKPFKGTSAPATGLAPAGSGAAGGGGGPGPAPPGGACMPGGSGSSGGSNPAAEGNGPPGPFDNGRNIIWRAGKTNPGNFKAPADGAVSFRSSLSNPWPMPKTGPVFAPGEPFSGIDISQLPPWSVEFDNVPPGHVSVRGVSPADLSALAKQTNLRGTSGPGGFPSGC